MFVTIDEPILVHYYELKFIAYISTTLMQDVNNKVITDLKLL